VFDGAGEDLRVQFRMSARMRRGYPETMTAMTDHNSEKSTAELVRDLTDQVGRLARTEVTLAAREIKDKAKHAGAGAAIAGAGGVLAFYGGATLVAGCVLLLALALPAWAAALIVAGALFAAAGVAALVARRQLRRGAPVPSPALDSAKEDIQTVREATHR
jgi:Flp pilus assembly protein TadB